MKTAEDAGIRDILEEAEEDLADAAHLAGRGASMALYQSSQAAEKFLAALAAAAGTKVSPMWDVARLLKAMEGLEPAAALAQPVKLLAEFSTPAKGGTAGARLPDAVRAARQVRAIVLRALGVDVPEEPAAPEPVAAPVTAPRPAAPAPDYEQQPRGDLAAAPQPEGERPRRPERSAAVLLCATCGVRIPRTRQTWNGRVPCPHCGKPMGPG
jgi:HEPN domain-containing protein